MIVIDFEVNKEDNFLLSFKLLLINRGDDMNTTGNKYIRLPIYAVNTVIPRLLAPLCIFRLKSKRGAWAGGRGKIGGIGQYKCVSLSTLYDFLYLTSEFVWYVCAGVCWFFTYIFYFRLSFRLPPLNRVLISLALSAASLLSVR